MCPSHLGPQYDLSRTKRQEQLGTTSGDCAPSQTLLRAPALGVIALRDHLVCRVATSLTLFAALVLLPGTSFASWISNGNRIGTNVEDAGGGVPISAAPDGRGGVFVASGAGPLHARLIRLLASGDVAQQWPADGRYFSADVWYPVIPVVLTDDAGGAFVVSTDLGCGGNSCQGNPTILRAHRMSPDATFPAGWPAVGFDLGTAGESSYGRRQPVSIPNGSGSVLTTWAQPEGEYRYPPDGGELRAQRVDVDGTLPWGPTGVLIRSTLLRAFNQTMAPDGAGGAYVFWQDDRAPGIYGQHIGADGRFLWVADGIKIALTPMTNLGPPIAVSDGSHGAIVAWSGTSGAQSGLFAARVTANGVLPQPRGQLVFQAGVTRIDGLQIVPAQGGAILAWHSLQGTLDKILAQQLDHAARPRWSPSAVTVCAAAGTRDNLALAPDNQGGAYLAWIDSRPDFSIYGMHLGRDGSVAPGWSVDGEPISARIPLATTPGATAAVSALTIAVADEGRPSEASAMVVWVDDRTPGSPYWTIPSPFAMLLTPRGPAAPPTGASPTPVTPNTDPRPDAGPLVPPLAIAPSSSGRIRVQLPDASDASLEIYDVAGRKAWAQEVGGLGPGTHEVAFVAGASLPSGVYMARLTHGIQTARTRFVILH